MSPHKLLPSFVSVADAPPLLVWVAFGGPREERGPDGRGPGRDELLLGGECLSFFFFPHGDGGEEA